MGPLLPVLRVPMVRGMIYSYRRCLPLGTNSRRKQEAKERVFFSLGFLSFSACLWLPALFVFQDFVCLSVCFRRGNPWLTLQIAKTLSAYNAFFFCTPTAPGLPRCTPIQLLPRPFRDQTGSGLFRVAWP